MGDRGNIAVIHDKQRKEQVWIYSHWGGSEMPQYLQQALKDGPDRWTDPSYFTRIVACRVIGKDIKGITGIGISGSLQDNEHKILVADCANQCVFLVEETDLVNGRIAPGDKPATAWSFKKFAELKKLPEN